MTHTPIHVDFYAVDLTEKQQVSIPVHSIGRSEAMETGLMVYQAMDQVTVEALPTDIPPQLEGRISPILHWKIRLQSLIYNN